MVRHPLLDLQPQEHPQRQRVRAPPLQTPLRLDSLEVADEEHPEVHARRDGGPSRLVERLEVGCAELLHTRVELRLRQQLVELLVEPVTR